MKIGEKLKNTIHLLNKENSNSVYGLSVLIFLIGIALGSFSSIFEQYALDGKDFPFFIGFFPLILCLSSLFAENLLLAITSIGLYFYPLLLLIGFVENNNSNEYGIRKFSFIFSVVFSIVLIIVFLGFFEEFIDDYHSKKRLGIYHHYVYFFILFSLIIPPIYEILHMFFIKIKYYYFILLFMIVFYLFINL